MIGIPRSFFKFILCFVCVDFHPEYKAFTIYNLEVQLSYWNGLKAAFGDSMKSQGQSVHRLRAGLKKKKEKVGIQFVQYIQK